MQTLQIGVNTLNVPRVVLQICSLWFVAFTHLTYNYLEPFLQQRPKQQAAHPSPTASSSIALQAAQKNLSQLANGSADAAPAPSQQNSTVDDTANTYSSSNASDVSAPTATTTTTPPAIVTDPPQAGEETVNNWRHITWQGSPLSSSFSNVAHFHLFIMNWFIIWTTWCFWSLGDRFHKTFIPLLYKTCLIYIFILWFLLFSCAHSKWPQIFSSSFAFASTVFFPRWSTWSLLLKGRNVLRHAWLLQTGITRTTRSPDLRQSEVVTMHFMIYESIFSSTDKLNNWFNWQDRSCTISGGAVS